MQTTIAGQKELLAVFGHDGTGFLPLVTFGSWRIAMNVSAEDEQLRTLQRHLETDEAFVLLEGGGAMLIADGEASPEGARWMPMEAMKVYNVRRNVWHAHVMRAGTRLLIVENEDTGDANSVTYTLTEGERAQLLTTMPPLLCG